MRKHLAKHLATMFLAFGLAGTAMADATPPDASTTTATTPAPLPNTSPNAKKWEELTGAPLPPLGPLVAAEQVGNALQQATLSPKTKLAAKQGLDDLKQQADVQLAPIVSVLEHGIAVKKTNENAKDDLVRRMNEHEATRPSPDATEGEVASFNARVDQLNQEATDLNDKINRDNDKFTKDIADATDTLGKWLDAHAGAYAAMGQKILSGEIKDDGLAWRQLRKAATGIEPAAEVFDGGNTSVDPSTVDARDVKKWTKEEREAEQKKPRSQLPKNFKKPTAPPPPPPSSVTAPATSSDTAKSKPAKPSR